jgi:hypothetical protein
MKRTALVILLGAWLAPAVFAQDHVEIGAYGDYFRLSQTSTNLAGLGGRLGVSANRYVQFEGEMNYDFEQAFTEGFTDTGTGTVTLQRTNLRLLHGLFGPKLHTRGPIQGFVTLKGGFINFRLDPRPATFDTFASSVENLRANDVSGVLYPGAGLEGDIGPLGLRLEVGDEMYFNQGTHHNVRVSFGPIIRF